jgi:branched-chain amino acid transport system substrate-binding protein
MVPAGEAARGFICATLHATGTHFLLIQDVRTYVYARGKGRGQQGRAARYIGSGAC